jgi:maleate isomerase
MWQPDGAGWRARVGVLTPHFDPVPETEFCAMAPEGVSIHAARVPLGALDSDGNITFQRGPAAARAFAEPPHIDHAAMLLSTIPVSVIVYAYTGSSYILGVDGDKALKTRLEARAPGIPVVFHAGMLPGVTCSGRTQHRVDSSTLVFRRLGQERRRIFLQPGF